MTGSVREALSYSFRLLSYRGRSEKELRERLVRKGFTEEAIEAVVARLKQMAHLDDAVLAESLRRQASEKRLLGITAARFFLRRRGIAEDVIAATLEYDEERELSQARRLLEKRLKSLGPGVDPSTRKRLYQYLTRRGYSPDVVRKVLREVDIVEEE